MLIQLCTVFVHSCTGFRIGRSNVTETAISGVNLFDWANSAAALRRKIPAGLHVRRQKKCPGMWVPGREKV
jgi:hypothetical protein